MENCCKFVNQLDWNTVAAIASAAAALLALVISIIVAYSQKKQAIDAQKISLFDKRYEIYCEFLRIYKLANFVERVNQHIVSEREQSNRLYIIDKLALEYGLLGERKFSEDYFYIKRKIRESGGADELRAISEEKDMEKEITEKLRYLKSTLIVKIKPAEFCYNEEIEKTMMDYVEALFDYIIPFSNHGDEETYFYLEEKIRLIAERKIIDSMRDMLNLSCIK